jgi:hypothetical protein
VWWRCEEPAKAVGGKVQKIPEKDVSEILEWPNQSDSLPWSLVFTTPDGKTKKVNSQIGWKRIANKHQEFTEMTAIFPKHEGVAVFARPDIPRATLAKSMRHQGIRTIADVQKPH